MADTPRTRAQILTLLADNSAGEISPQDMRDAIVSLFGVYGIIRTVGNATIQALTAATPAKLANFSENGVGVGATPDYQNNKITLDNGGTYVLLAQVSLKSSVDDAVIELNLAIDDVAGDGKFDLHLENLGKAASGMCFDLLAINAAEVLSLIIESDKTANITVIDAQLLAVRIG